MQGPDENRGLVGRRVGGISDSEAVMRDLRVCNSLEHVDPSDHLKCFDGMLVETMIVRFGKL